MEQQFNNYLYICEGTREGKNAWNEWTEKWRARAFKDSVESG